MAARIVPTIDPAVEATCAHSLACGSEAPPSSAAHRGIHCTAPHVPRRATPASPVTSISRRSTSLKLPTRKLPPACALCRYRSTGYTYPPSATASPIPVPATLAPMLSTAGDHTYTTSPLPAHPITTATRSRAAQNDSPPRRFSSFHFA